MNGIVIINKQKDYTSHDVVAKVKKILNEKKVGHTGTLDPNATGVLPILLGQGTKLSKYLINHDKIYNVTLKLGQKTETGDIEGKIIETKQVTKDMIKKENVEKILKSFIGKQEQIPPMYSAIKVKGKKLYEYARKGQAVQISPRKIEIYDIKLLSIEDIYINTKKNVGTHDLVHQNTQIKFQVACSKGTYIRSLCEDIAQKIGTVGYMKELQRIKVGDFCINQAISLQQLENIMESAVITIEEFLLNKEKIVLNEKELRLFINGVNLSKNTQDNIYRIYNKNDKFIGTGVVNNNRLKRDIII